MKKLYVRALLFLLRPVLTELSSRARLDGREQARIDASQSDRLPWKIRDGRLTLDRDDPLPLIASDCTEADIRMMRREFENSMSQSATRISPDWVEGMQAEVAAALAASGDKPNRKD